MPAVPAMLLNDPLTLLYIVTPFGLMTTLVLCLSYVGHGRHSVALHGWIAGDLVLACYRVVPMLQPGLVPERWAWLGLFTPQVAFVLNISLLLVAIGAHSVALNHLGGRRAGRAWHAAVLVGPALVFAGGAGLLLHSGLLVPWFTGVLAVAIAYQLRITWPLQRHYRGAWGLIAGHVALIAFHAWNTLALTLQPLPPLAFDEPDLPSMMAMGMDFMVSFLFTLSFALMLQEQLRQQIVQLSITDSLTGALNRRGAGAQLDQQWAQALLQRYPISVAMIDLDHFKRINDEHGHAFGDAALQHFAGTVLRLKRHGDVFVRWGGEEFLLVLPNTRTDQASALLARVRDALAEPSGLPFGIHFSAGVADSRALLPAAKLEALLAVADKALYRAKAERGRVEVVC
ncbi:diguanylate cyclase [Pseudomonas sp. NPDC007930]|uniref:GGDEF domain-containing protein n=1 Tax=Pseudomonas sp. NPDC007930 TaxID=3364417 RepID=UPI0036E6BD53